MLRGEKPHATAGSASLLERKGFELPVVFAFPLFRERSCRKENLARWFPKNRTEKFLRRDPSARPCQNEAPESNCSAGKVGGGMAHHLSRCVAGLFNLSRQRRLSIFSSSGAIRP
jgi:hypothetical protein